MSRLIVILALTAAIAIIWLVMFARAGERVECEPQRVTGDKSHWSWRVVDGRTCWYRGHPGKPKSELHWGDRQRPGAVAQPEVERITPPHDLGPATPRREVVPDDGRRAELPADTNSLASYEEARALTADELLASTCCWPDLAELEAELIGLRKARAEEQPPRPSARETWDAGAILLIYGLLLACAGLFAAAVAFRILRMWRRG